MRKQVFILCCMIVLLCASAVGILFYFSNETNMIQEQEEISQLIAEEYLIYVTQQAEMEMESENTSAEESSDLDYDDNQIYHKFSENDALGYIDCVLEIPAIDLRQSVYSGTVDQIEHDLSHFLAVTARANYVLGDTQYCIYMHNPTDQSIRISYAQENLHQGDYMIITQKNTVYFYEVADVFPEWRNKCTDIYVNATNIPSNKLYILTCGRDEWQGQNVVIEGTIYATYDIISWNEHKDQYIEDYKKDVGIIKKEPDATQEQLILSVEAKNESVIVSLRSPNYTTVTGCSVGVFDSSGYLIEDIVNPIDYVGQEMMISDLPEGEYYVGIYQNDTEYKNPTPYKLIINKETHVQTIVAMDQNAKKIQHQTEVAKTVALIMLSCAILFGILIIVKTRQQKK